MSKLYTASQWSLARRDYHIANPEPGDYWIVNSGNPVMVIVDVGPKFVTAFRHGSSESHCWQWDADRPEFIRRDGLEAFLCNSQLHPRRLFEEVHRWREGNSSTASPSPSRRAVVHTVTVDSQLVFASFHADERANWLAKQSQYVQTLAAKGVVEIDLTSAALDIWAALNALQKLVLLDTGCVIWQSKFVDPGPCYAGGQMQEMVICRSPSEQ